MSKDRFHKNFNLISRFDPMLSGRINEYRKRDVISEPDTGDVEIAVQDIKSGNVRKITDYSYLKNSNLIIIYGFGNGGHIRDIVQSTPQSTFVLVIEDSLSFFMKMLYSIDLEPIISCGRVKLSVEEEPGYAVRHNLENYMGVVTICEFNVIKNPASVQCAVSYYEKIDLEIEDLKKSAQLNRNTIERFSLTWQSHIFLNLKYILSCSGVGNLFGKFRNIPAIIVSAGPSLDKNIKWLYGFENRCLIVAVDSALRSLQENGIRAHLVLSLDPKPDNFLHMEGINTEETILVMNPVTYPEIPKNHNGPIVNMTFGDPLMAWIEESIGELGETLAGGSVSTAAFDLAVKMGCFPIILVGQDLSFESNRAYTSWCYFSKRWEDSVKRNIPLSMILEDYIRSNKTDEAENFFESSIPTSQKMYSWKIWLERMAVGRGCVNATEGGLNIENFEPLVLQEALAIHCRGSYPVSKLLKEKLSDIQKPDIMNLRERFLQYLYTLKEVSRIGHEGMEIATGLIRLVEMQETGRDLNYYLGRLSELSAEVMDASEFMKINQWEIDSLLHKISERQGSETDISRIKKQDVEGKRGLMLKNIDTYKLLFAEINRISEWGIQQVREGIKIVELLNHKTQISNSK